MATPSKMKNNGTETLTMALFGESGAGKTTLLASYYGHQVTNKFNAKHGYSLETAPAKSDELIARFHQLERGRFPGGTNVFNEYEFGLQLDGISGDCMKIVWYDYPGGWWQTTPRNQEEQKERMDGLSKLLRSNVAILLIDGKNYVSGNSAEIQRQLRIFALEIKRIMKLATDNNEAFTSKDLPTNWLIAISKADLLDEYASAESVAEEICSKADDELKSIQKLLGEGSNFGKEFLLLSSVKAQGQSVTDASKYMGIQLIAPVAFLSILRTLIEKAQPGVVVKSLNAIFPLLKSVIPYLDRSDDWLPAKYQAISKILKLLAILEIATKGEAYFRKRQKNAAAKGDKMDALASTLVAELKSNSAQREYYKLP